MGRKKGWRKPTVRVVLVPEDFAAPGVQEWFSCGYQDAAAGLDMRGYLVRGSFEYDCYLCGYVFGRQESDESAKI